jgi:hypothetical protein
VATNPSAEGRRTRTRSEQSPGPRTEPSTAALRMVAEDSGGYQLPVIHLQLPEGVVNMTFWGALVASAALGAIDPPIAALIGLGVVVARHRRSNSTAPTTSS